MTATPKETEVRLQHPLLRRAGLHLLAEAGHPRRLPRALQGHQGPHRPRRRGLPAREGQDSTATARRSRTASTTTKDFDRTLVIDDRTKLVAKKVTEFLKESGDRFQKTIVFCVDHGARRADAAGAHQRERRPRAPRTTATSCASPATTPKAQDQLGNFIDPEVEVSRCSSPPRACSPPASMRRPAG